MKSSKESQFSDAVSLLKQLKISVLLVLAGRRSFHDSCSLPQFQIFWVPKSFSLNSVFFVHFGAIDSRNGK